MPGRRAPSIVRPGRRNKARIAGALGRFIANNFLTPKVLSERLAEVDAAHWIADWIANPDSARRLARNVAFAVPEVVRVLPREQIADVLRGLEAMPAAPVAANLLAIVWAQGQTQTRISASVVVSAVMTLSAEMPFTQRGIHRDELAATLFRNEVPVVDKRSLGQLQAPLDQRIRGGSSSSRRSSP
jgi:uncharacterized membrane-anchored protein YjiN (DUF445 family)